MLSVDFDIGDVVFEYRWHIDLDSSHVRDGICTFKRWFWGGAVLAVAAVRCYMAYRRIERAAAGEEGMLTSGKVPLEKTLIKGMKQISVGIIRGGDVRSTSMNF